MPVQICPEVKFCLAVVEVMHFNAILKTMFKNYSLKDVHH